MRGKSLLTVTLTVLLGGLTFMAPAAGANAAAGERAAASACRTIEITGRRVALLEYPFTNADPLRVRKRGQRLTSCRFVKGNGSNGYANKCGRRGHNWFEVRIPRTRTAIGLTVTRAFVPATCARVVAK